MWSFRYLVAKGSEIWLYLVMEVMQKSLRNVMGIFNILFLKKPCCCFGHLRTWNLAWEQGIYSQQRTSMEGFFLHTFREQDQ